MPKSITVTVKDAEQTHDQLTDAIFALIEMRTVETSEADDIRMSQQLQGYIMGLEDLYFRLYGERLKGAYDTTRA